MTARSIVVEQLVQAPPGPVWEAMTDIDSWEEVLTGVDRVQVLTPGGFGVGTRWRETRRMLGAEGTEEMAVTACEPPERYVVEADSHGTHYVSEFLLLTAGEGATTVRMTFSAALPDGPRGLLARLLGPIGARAARRAIARDLADMARAAEARRP
ncbi:MULTISPECIES: SRPBCC family protein [unclassified Streptomyces]|uniref:SRPBCC family protein n=1 Tax=unclassified Streptomyces TaxID=2593676 RepID=UPI00341A4BB9